MFSYVLHLQEHSTAYTQTCYLLFFVRFFEQKK